jgi:hypothetical protein
VILPKAPSRVITAFRRTTSSLKSNEHSKSAMGRSWPIPREFRCASRNRASIRTETSWGGAGKILRVVSLPFAMFYYRVTSRCRGSARGKAIECMVFWKGCLDHAIVDCYDASVRPEIYWLDDHEKRPFQIASSAWGGGQDGFRNGSRGSDR